MPTATVEMTRDAAYIVVVFRPKSFCVGSGPNGFGQWRYCPLPDGLFAFKSEGCLADKENGVGILLTKDASGVDLMPMLAAADFLRDSGWTVEPLGWCKQVMERVQQGAR